jgi:S1-C subfamily serine protease
VIAGAQQLLVSLPDGRSFSGRVVGGDPDTDLAVVQIQGENLPVARLGDSGRLKAGEWVVAIGNALALPGGPTITVGVASALGRTVQEPGSTGGAGPFLFDVIQTDAAINPGNSGGALVNLDGDVIGINTLVAGEVESGVQAQGIGFAIAIATAKPIADQLVASGKVVHPYVGMQYVPLSPAIAARLRATVTQGVLVGNVAPGSPAGRARLRANDRFAALDSAALVGESDFARAVEKHKPGDTVTLTVIRSGQTLEVKLTLGER